MIHRFSFEPCPSHLSVTSKVVEQNQLSVPNVGGFYCEDQRAVYHGDCPRVYQRVTLPNKNKPTTVQPCMEETPGKQTQDYHAASPGVKAI